MSKTEFGQDLSSNSANSVYLLKTEDDTITGILSLENGGDLSKHVSDLQTYLFTITDVLGMVGEFDPNAKVYSSTEIIANGDNRKVAISKLDAQVKVNIDNIAANLVLINQNAADIADILASIGLSSTLAPIGVGIAPLDADGKVPLIHLPNALLIYKGGWDASTNTPTLANTDLGVTNFWYRVNVAGSVDFGAGAILFNVGDKVVNNGTLWEKWDTNDEVTSVNGYTGDVVITKTDLGLDNVTNDAQLKRAGGDFVTFPSKANPIAADYLLIEDSEATNAKKLITIGQIAPTFIQEELAGTVDGVNLIFSTSTTPKSNAGCMVFLNGLLQYQGEDYTILSGTITFAVAPEIGQRVFAFYN